VLEALRASESDAAVLFASTNKVYGGLEHLDVVERNGRYTYARGISGVNEECPLDFHSPYGCSKGAADQYVRDYHRIYGIRTVVFRQSCIYGYRQFGVEDQGWVAWFTIAAHLQRCLRIYGDGKQVRDVLFIDDLLDAYDAAFERIDRAAGRVYNIGGGPDNAVSIQQFLEYLQLDVKRPLRPSYHCWRAGDQKVYISDIQRSADELGWTPRVPWRAGVDLLSDWVRQNREMFQCV
jgi:CDP-paratose 2-epimerase